MKIFETTTSYEGTAEKLKAFKKIDESKDDVKLSISELCLSEDLEKKLAKDFVDKISVTASNSIGTNEKNKNEVDALRNEILAKAFVKKFTLNDFLRLIDMLRYAATVRGEEVSDTNSLMIDEDKSISEYCISF